MEEQDAGLEELLPQPVTLRAGGADHTIHPFTFGQLPRVLKHIGALIGAINGGGLDLSALSEAGGESIIELVAIATGESREWFDRLPADEGLRLVCAVIEVNQDFFARRLAPELETMTQVLSGLKSSNA